MEQDLKRFLTNSQLPRSGGVMAKEKNSDIFFFQPTPLLVLFRAESKFYGKVYLIINLTYLVKNFFETGPLPREEKENPSIIK